MNLTIHLIMCIHIITLSLDIILASSSIINNKYNKDIRNTKFVFIDLGIQKQLIIENIY
jgi:hypothetical protein